MKSNEMLTAWVKSLIGSGWQPWEEEFKKDHKQKHGDYVVTVEDGCIEIKVCTARVVDTNRYNEETVESLYDDLFSGSLPDLLADSSAKVYGEEKVCCSCGVPFSENITDLETDFCEDCGYQKFIPAWQYHAIQAIKLLHKGEDAIEYLYNNLPKGEKG